MVNQTVKVYAIAQQTSLVILSIMLKLDSILLLGQKDKAYDFEVRYLDSKI